MPRGKCHFSDRWLDETEFKVWLQRFQGDDTRAYCKLCKKDFGVGNSGRKSLDTHAKGAKHKSLEQGAATSSTLTSLFASSASPGRRSPSSQVISLLPSTASSTLSQAPRICGSVESSARSASDVLAAEVLWVLKAVTSHYSYSSCNGIGDLMRRMFPDSDIARNFGVSERKCSYFCCFGLGPYIKSLLNKSLRAQPSFVLLFDESLNKKTKKKQLDVHVRMWHDGTVCTRYFDSAFIGHASAEHLVETILDVLESLELRKIVQISMDGPNVNWKFHRLFQEHLRTTTGVTALEVGSCGLHIVHGAFQAGAAASGWGINDLLTSLYYLFKDCPARREDYVSVTNVSNFPMKFCPHRWVENGPVAERALQLWNAVKTYVAAVEAKQVANPSTVSVSTVKKFAGDVTVPAKLACFISVCHQFAPFLKKYQDDQPLLPFLGDDLFSLMRNLMRRYIKNDVIDGITKSQLMALDPSDREHFAGKSNIDLGLVADELLKPLLCSRKVSDLRLMELKMAFRSFLVTILTKLKAKAPLKYPLVRHLSCLDPSVMANQRDTAVKKMRSLLPILVDAGRVSGGLAVCDDIVRQFREFLEVEVASDDSFSSFKPGNAIRLDSLLAQHLAGKSHYASLWSVVKDLLLLSHGQASVERGFSVNKQVEDDNLAERSVVARRLVCDFVASSGGISGVEVTKPLLQCAASAHQQYKAFLEEEKRKSQQQVTSLKRKALLDDIETAKAKRQRLEKDVAELTTSADNFAERAESAGDLTWLAKSNSLRRTVKAKQEEILGIAALLDEKANALKLCPQ